MSNSLKKIFSVFVFITILVLLLFSLDRRLSRNGRIRYEQEYDRLVQLQDALYRYHLKVGKPPQNLRELFPGFAPETLLKCVPDLKTGNEVPILWEPETGVLAWPEPMVIRGITTKYLPLSLNLTFPELPKTISMKKKLSVPEKPKQPVPDPPPVKTDPEEPAPAVTEPAAIPQENPEDTSPQHEPAEPVVTDDTSVIIEPVYLHGGRELQPAPEGVIVIEAEQFQSMTYGWQIGEAPDCGGGGYLHIKEGVGDFESEGKLLSFPIRTGDVYGATGDNRRIQADLFVSVPVQRQYYVYVRTMAHRSSCSNITHIKINSPGRVQVGHNGSRPFVWLWHFPGIFRFKKGFNLISFQTHQDDVKIDQLLISPRPLRLGEFDPRVFMQTEDAQKQKQKDSITLSVSYKSRSVFKGEEPEIDVYIRKNASLEFEGQLKVSVPELFFSRLYTVRLSRGERLARVRLPDFPDWKEKREYVLRTAVSVGDREKASGSMVISNGYDWNVLGPFPCREGVRHSFVDPGSIPVRTYSFQSKEYTWKPYSHTFTDRFGMLDFGRMLTGDTFHGPEHVSLYGYTEITAEKNGEYILTAMGDDDITVWVNGKEIVRIFEKGPPIRTARQKPVYLDKGTNRILFRLEQKKDQWQAQVYIRNKDYTPADVVGIPFAGQSIPK